MIISLGGHELLQKFGHVSNTSISTFLQIISNIIIRSVIQRIIRSIFWGAIVDESTDVSNESQFITYVRFIENGEIIILFLDIRPLGSDGQTALNLHKTFIGIAQSYDLNIAFLARMCFDGAASILGIKTGLVTRIKSDFPEVGPTHCVAHRFNFASEYSINSEDVIELKYAENMCLTLWKFFPLLQRKPHYQQKPTLENKLNKQS
ncbi:MAG: hypothetical protein EZS28_008122 [Streblomastix strix]|uniref:Uncharacterized protein n=1 Tax=Streblomastix strix TaxID=222440 RepID=A0A5J4WQG2_9EUKA|nr:MAG: hypothetical protein EZS28_008122 [Streblomastix strix]